MSEIIDIQALLTVAVVSFLGANALVLFFGLTLVGISRFGQARSENRNSLPYAALAVLAAIVCLVLLVAGFLAIIGG